MSSTNHCYIVYFRDVCYPIDVSEGAKVDSLQEAILSKLKRNKILQEEEPILLKCSSIPIMDVPSEEYITSVAAWIREHAKSERMLPARRLSRYFPVGPAAERDEKIDVIVVTESILKDIKATSSETSRKRRKISGSSETMDEGSGIVRLNGSSEIPEDQIAFALHSYLWGKPKNLYELINSVWERIPHLELSPATSDLKLRVSIRTEFQFMNLAKVPGWPDEKQTLVAAHFLIRDEYRQLDQFSHDGRNVLLLGHPGIGKTVYLTYSLVNRLAEGRPTFFCARKTRRYLFQASGVYRVSGEAFGMSVERIIEKQSDNTLCLYDLNASQTEFINTRNWRVVVASSPKQCRYKEWAKHSNALKFVMRTWPWQEIYASRSMAIQKDRTLNDWRAAYVKYGGSARNLLSRLEFEVNKDIKQAINNCENVGSLLVSPDREIKDHSSHQLVETNPAITDDGLVDRLSLSNNVISLFILEKLKARWHAKIAMGMKDHFRRLLSTSQTRSAAGILFESASYTYLFRNFTNTNTRKPLLRARSLAEPALPDLDLMLPHIDQIEYLDNIETLRSRLLHTKYYVPLSARLPGIDSFALEVNDQNHIIGVIMFQFTVATEHPINANFLNALRYKTAEGFSLNFANDDIADNEVSDASYEADDITSDETKNDDGVSPDSIKWKLIFVIPQDSERTFKKQKWKTDTAKVKWDKKVDQYKLVVTDEDVLEGMK